MQTSKSAYTEHFFRVINKNGEYSPLKHTVNVPITMQASYRNRFLWEQSMANWFFIATFLPICNSERDGKGLLFMTTPRDDSFETFIQ